MRALSAAIITFVLASCANSEEIDLESELQACLLSPIEDTLLPLRSSSEFHSLLIKENPRLAESYTLHRKLTKYIPTDTHAKLIRDIESAKREFVEYREANPVKGGFAGTATTGYRGADFDGENHHLYQGLIELLPAYHAASLEAETGRLVDELNGIREQYRMQLEEECDDQTPRGPFRTCGMWVRTDFDMLEMVPPGSAEELMLEQLYRAGAWEEVRKLRPNPSIKEIKYGPRRGKRCANWYLGDQPDSEFEDVKPCQFILSAALRAGEFEIAVRLARKSWSKEMAVADSFNDFGLPLTSAAVDYRVTGKRKLIRETVEKAIAIDDDDSLLPTPRHKRPISLFSNCVSLLSKTECQSILYDIVSADTSCEEKKTDSGVPKFFRACRRILGDAHPEVLLEQDYPEGAIVSSTERISANQPDFLYELSESLPFVQAVAETCASKADKSAHAGVLWPGRKDPTDRLKSLAHLTAHQMVAVSSMRSGDLAKAEDHLRIAVGMLETQDDRKPVFPVILLPMGNSSRDYQTAVMLLLTAEFEFLSDSAQESE